MDGTPLYLRASDSFHRYWPGHRPTGLGLFYQFQIDAPAGDLGRRVVGAASHAPGRGGGGKGTVQKTNEKSIIGTVAASLVGRKGDEGEMDPYTP